MRHSQGFSETGEKGQFFSGEQGNKGLKIRGTGEHRQFWGTGNIENQDFVLGEQGNAAIFFSRGGAGKQVLWETLYSRLGNNKDSRIGSICIQV